MDYDESDFADRSVSKNKSTWFSAQDVGILADLVRSHAGLLRNVQSSSSRLEKKQVWDIITELLASKTNVPRTTRQVQKKWSNLRSSVKRAARSKLGTSVLPHYFLPVVKYFEEEESVESSFVSQNSPEPEEEVDVVGLPKNVLEQPNKRRKTYAHKIQQIQQQQEAEEKRFAVLRQIKVESVGEVYENERREEEEEEEGEEEECLQNPNLMHFSHTLITDPLAVSEQNIHRENGLSSQDPLAVMEHETNHKTENVYTRSNQDLLAGMEHDRNRRGTESVYAQSSQDWRRSHHNNRETFLLDNESEDGNGTDESHGLKKQLLKAQLLLIQKQTALAQKEIEKRDKEMSVIDKELLKINLEIDFMKKRYRWEEKKMGLNRF